jgi:hypothetical protein
MKTILAILAIAALSLSTSVNSTPLHYSESESGELGGLGGALDFDIGLNTVTGTARANFGTRSFDFDDFTFNLPERSQLTSITYNLLSINARSPTSTLLILIPALRQTILSPTIISSEQIFLLRTVSPIPLFGAQLPRTEESFFFVNAYSGFGDYVWDYRLDIEVSSVPLPTAAWLFSSGLIGLIGVVRRKNRR